MNIFVFIKFVKSNSSLITFFFFDVILVTVDVFTDLYQAFQYYQYVPI